MRARWLKPEFFKDRKIGALGMAAALVYQALWCMADDVGTSPCDPDRIKGEMFFAWPDVGLPNISGALQALSESGRIRRYRVGDDTYCKIVQFEKHQNVHNPSKFRYPDESQADTGDTSGQVSSTTESFGSAPEGFGGPHILDSYTPRHLETSSDDAPSARAAKSPPDERVDQVLEHYRRRHPRRRPGSTKDKGAIKRALKQYSVEDLCAAIDGNAADPWHFERAKHELTYVLRDSGKIDQFIALATAPTPASNGSAPAAQSRASPLVEEYAVFDDLMRVVNAAGGYRNLGPEWYAAQSEPVRRAISAMGGLKSLANADEIGLRIKRKTFAEALAASAHDTPREATA